MKVIYINFVLILILIFVGCASKKIKISSEPQDAEVFIINKSTNERKPIGKTPIEVLPQELNEQLGSELSSGELFTLVITKSGYKEELITLPFSGFGLVDAQLDIKLTESAAALQLSSVEELLKRLFLAQRFALTQQYERALIELDAILNQHPRFARALSMKGSVYLAQKKYDDSLKWYEEALKVDPQMEETVKLVARVRELIGSSRSPASR